MRDAPKRRDLVEMSFTWPDIERAVAQDDAALAAALEQAFRVEASAGSHPSSPSARRRPLVSTRVARLEKG